MILGAALYLIIGLRLAELIDAKNPLDVGTWMWIIFLWPIIMLVAAWMVVRRQ